MKKHIAIAKVHPQHQAMADILDQASLSAVHYRLWLLATAGPLLSGVSMMVLGISLPLLRGPFLLSPSSMGVAAASLMGGTVIGALVSGHLADRFGRRPLLIANAFGLLLAGIWLSLAPDTTLLILGELFLGIAVGGDFPVGSSYISEFMPQKHRGRMLAASMALQPLGMLLSAGIALLLLHGGGAAWRWLMASQAILTLPYFLGRWYLPESVRWLMAHGKNQIAAKELTRFVPQRVAELQRMAIELGTQVHEVSKTPLASKIGWSVLFTAEYRRRTLLVTLPWFLMDMATYGIGLFTPILFASVSTLPRDLPTWHKDWINTLHTGGIDLFLLAGAFAALWLVPRFGRMQMQISGFLGMALGLFLVWQASTAHWSFFALLLGFALYNFTMTVGPNATTFILPTEMYPTQVRALGSGFAAAFAKIGATLAVFLLPILQQDLGVGLVLLGMALLSLLGGILTYTFRVEGHGLTLEEHHGLLRLRSRQVVG
ncbi:MFS transporter [Acidithiobacillus sp. IBUN Pt1247-S3]|uniref:MFS transporter n=1 Tax=Acidithiobacillus sp. IBUN Pt1247-S3 TaxID=3166642 RepID=UPI0034E43924